MYVYIYMYMYIYTHNIYSLCSKVWLEEVDKMEIFQAWYRWENFPHPHPSTSHAWAQQDAVELGRQLMKYWN